MTSVVGMPRALAYHDYFPFWEAFFDGFGVRLTASPPTNKALVHEGVRRAVDGTCFPVKILLGHVHWLIENGYTTIFLPRFVSVAPKEYICPKFMGLPDMVQATFGTKAKFLVPTIDLNLPKKCFYEQIQTLGSEFGCSPKQTKLAFRQGLEALRDYRDALLKGRWPANSNSQNADNNQPTLEVEGKKSLKVGLLGHSYLIYDDFANMHIVNKLQNMEVEVMTVDMLPDERIDAQSLAWPKRMFWTSGRRILGAAREYVEMRIPGIIYVTAFACGTDSLTAELVERTLRRESPIPQLILNLDEHTGEAGIVTRLEAFVDMLRWRINR
ncbi:MAG: hypothetical protein GX316_05505 [Firmicutes bacterium]|nr:hypothetical protein [Bacillota bacterium]